VKDARLGHRRQGLPDFVAGIAVTSLGYAHPCRGSDQQQAAEPIRLNLFYSVPQVTRGAAGAGLLPGPCLLPEQRRGGAERASSWRQGGNEKKDGAYGSSPLGGFHGRTLAAVNASGTARCEPFAAAPGFINALQRHPAIKDNHAEDLRCAGADQGGAAPTSR
jgi:hypothetical protein